MMKCVCTFCIASIRNIIVLLLISALKINNKIYNISKVGLFVSVNGFLERGTEFKIL